MQGSRLSLLAVMHYLPSGGKMALFDPEARMGVIGSPRSVNRVSVPAMAQPSDRPSCEYGVSSQVRASDFCRGCGVGQSACKHPSSLALGRA